MTALTRTAPAFWLLLAALLAGACQTSCNRAHTQDIETLRKAYAALNRGDIPAAVEAMDPNVEWTEPAEFPGGRTYHGPAGVRTYLAQSRAG